MMNKSLDNNYRTEELVLHNEMHYEIQNEKSMIQKFEVCMSVVSTNLIDVST
jgi:hypothetical protein